MIRPDFITSVVLIAVGLATLFESWRMPRFTEFGASPYSAPGLVPGMLGVALALLGAILCLRTVGTAPADGEEAREPGGWIRVAGAFALCVAYAAVLVGRLPFWLATFVFIVAFIAVFERPDPALGVDWLRRLAVAALVAAAASAAVSYVFQEVFFVRLP